jgi:hypothetical protein
MQARTLLLTAPLAFGACTNPPPISSNPGQTVVKDITAVAPAPVATIQTGLLNAEWNLDQAIAKGILPANDPADTCMHAALTQIGIEPAPAGTPSATPPESFTPKVTDLISGGAVVYIEAQQVKKLESGGTIAPSCKQLIGQLVLDAAAVGIKAIPGGGILPAVQ